jgi:mono/diheme cytochrome c family protein
MKIKNFLTVPLHVGVGFMSRGALMSMSVGVVVSAMMSTAAWAQTGSGASVGPVSVAMPTTTTMPTTTSPALTPANNAPVPMTAASVHGTVAANESEMPALPADADTDVRRGAYLAVAGDCIACHVAKAGKPFAGGLAIATPLGVIYSTNISPSKTAGIGNYTVAQFGAALREGKRADGAHLYPAMPYTAYAKLNDADIASLYAYFMRGVQPVDEAAPQTALPFPFNMRFSMAGWNLLFADGKPFVPDVSQNAEWNRGAYLVEGLAHCSTCHTPRNFLMAEETSKMLGGGYVGTWFAPNITSDAISGLGSWSVADVTHYLQTGVAVGKAQAAGPMAEAIHHSFSHMSDEDVHAMAVYLKGVPSVHDAADTQSSASWGKPISDSDQVRGQAWPDDANKLSGAQLYDANCASCHGAKGQGTPDGGLPSLFHNTAVGHVQADNMVMTILQGDPLAQGVAMPAFAEKLSDEQVATLSNYLIDQFGNPSTPKLTVDQVRTMRAGGAPSPLLKLAHIGMAVAVMVLILLILLVMWARRRRHIR